MECVNHPGVPAFARCVGCGACVCRECARELDGRNYCENCALPQLRPYSGPLEIERAFQFILDDPGWPGKLAIGGLMVLGSIVVVPLLIALGYMVEVIRCVANGEDRTLPRWDNLGGKLKEGAGLFVVSLVYSVPVFLLTACMFVAALFAEGGTSNGAPPGAASWCAVLAFMFLWVAVMLLALLTRFVSPAYAGRFALTSSIAEGLRFGEIARMVRRDAKPFLIVLVLTIATGFIAGIGVIACCVGMFFTTFYAMLVNAHLYGQLARLRAPEVDSSAR